MGCDWAARLCRHVKKSTRCGYGAMSPMASQDYYRTLQVTPDAEPEVIEAAYKRLAFKYHADRNPAPDAHTRMVLLNFRVHRAGINGFAHRRDPGRIPFQRHAALWTITRLFRFHAGTHRAKIFRHR